MNHENTLTQKPDFIHERGPAHILRLGFIPGTQFEDFEEKLLQLFQYAMAKKQGDKTRKLQLCFDSSFEGKWGFIWETLLTFFDQLPNIHCLDFQHSDLRLVELLQLYQIYLKSHDMENLPKICVFDTYAHDEYKELFRKLENEKRGKEFLKRVYFPENKYLPEPWSA